MRAQLLEHFKGVSHRALVTFLEEEIGVTGLEDANIRHLLSRSTHSTTDFFDSFLPSIAANVQEQAMVSSLMGMLGNLGASQERNQESAFHPMDTRLYSTNTPHRH